jgi:drug/metabolite transporter (DMT)-like permease|tara:strand:- start:1981 stop:2892 length:912 start_codon:yes stop_codon:yes gene_type:complete
MSLNWVNLAVLGAVTLGMVNVVDSHLLSRRMPSFRAFLLLLGISMLVSGLVVFYLYPLPENVDTWPMVVAVASAVFRLTSLTIMIYTLRTEEVSRVVPAFHIYPVFVAIIAVPLLKEVLSSLQWLAIVIVVAGAVIVSAKRNQGGTITWLGKLFPLLFGAGLLMAIADVASKYALDFISFWNMYWINALCMAGIFLLVSLRPRIIKELINMRRRSSSIGLLVLNEMLAVIGILLVFRAMENGPVSLVSTITGSRPIFVLIFVLILNRFRSGFLIEGQSDKGTLALRVIATAMIVGGIAIIYLD